ncbi:Kinesin- motor protein, partial [Tilletia horrida]
MYKRKAAKRQGITYTRMHSALTHKDLVQVKDRTRAAAALTTSIMSSDPKLTRTWSTRTLLLQSLAMFWMATAVRPFAMDKPVRAKTIQWRVIFHHIHSSGTFASGAGIISRTLFRIFHQLEQSGAEFSVRVKYVELYYEEARDRLADEDLNATTAADESDVPATKKTRSGAQVKAGNGGKSQASSSSSNHNNNKAGIRILNDPKRRVKREGVEEVLITSAEPGLRILPRGSAKRQVTSMNCNSQSSRSHSIFMLTIHRTTATDLSSFQSGPAHGGPSATGPSVLGADGQPVTTAASGQSGEDVLRTGQLNL